MLRHHIILNKILIIFGEIYEGTRIFQASLLVFEIKCSNELNLIRNVIQVATFAAVTREAELSGASSGRCLGLICNTLLNMCNVFNWSATRDRLVWLASAKVTLSSKFRTEMKIIYLLRVCQILQNYVHACFPRIL